MKRERRTYRSADGKAPFEDWLEALRDINGRAKIRVRLDRAVHGNFGDHRSVGGGIIELRVHDGPGYRIYLGLHGDRIIVLLCGGDKNTQRPDILNARKYWTDYKGRL